MLEIIVSAVIGYLLGSLSPAALFSKLKKKNLRKQGTGNLGATNTMLVMGKRYGVVVMLFDIVKAFAAVKLAHMLFPSLLVAGIVSGGAAVVGHIYPFYLKFRGGKGLAAFGGLVLAVDPLLFLGLLVISLALMFAVNYSAAMPMSAGVLFPILYAIRVRDPASVLIAVSVSFLIIVKHLPNVFKAIRGEDIRIREYVKEHFLNY